MTRKMNEQRKWTLALLRKYLSQAKAGRLHVEQVDVDNNLQRFRAELGPIPRETIVSMGMTITVRMRVQPTTGAARRRLRAKVKLAAHST